jgi:hypothetical protein
MTTRLDKTAPGGRRFTSAEIGKFLFRVVLVVTFFLLGQRMVRHRFFRGGSRNQNGSIR